MPDGGNGPARLRGVPGSAFRQETTALFLQAQLDLGRKAPARALLATVLKRDPNHALAADLNEELH